jgi:aminoglycoside phosphotransferase
MIHKVGISKCPFDMRLAVKLNEAKNFVEKVLVGRENFEPENLQKSPQENYQELLARIPKSENLVFTNGDYCLPNIIIKKGKINRFVDLGRGGVAVRCQDISLAVRSIRHNLKSEKFVELFLDAYGLKNVDFTKIDYYILLDELF